MPQTHLSEENLEAIRLVTGLLVTFAALVLSLQLSSVKASFDQAYRDRGLDAARLAQLDQCLRNYGTETEQPRGWLRQYTGTVIASTWPDEPAPAGVTLPAAAGMTLRGENATLAGLMNKIGLAVNALSAVDALHQNLAARCREAYAEVQTSRWTVIEDAYDSSSPLFAKILTCWLMLVFLSFGLQVPRKRVAVLVVGIGVLSISSVMFVIMDLDRPYGGLFGISSTAMRHALADMLRTDEPAP